MIKIALVILFFPGIVKVALFPVYLSEISRKLGSYSSIVGSSLMQFFYWIWWINIIARYGFKSLLIAAITLSFVELLLKKSFTK